MLLSRSLRAPGPTTTTDYYGVVSHGGGEKVNEVVLMDHKILPVKSGARHTKAIKYRTTDTVQGSEPGLRLRTVTSHTATAYFGLDESSKAFIIPVTRGLGVDGLLLGEKRIDGMGK